MAKHNDGPYESYHENGQLREKGTYVAGELDGPYESYYDNGQLEEKGTYKDGERDGPWEMAHDFHPFWSTLRFAS